MTAPDKIYIESNGKDGLYPDWSADRYLGHFEKVEYIRKDALVEYINKYLEENREWKEANPSDRFFGGREVALEDLLEHLNTM